MAVRSLSKVVFWLCCAGGAIIALLPADMLAAPIFNWWDKAQHASGFAILGLLARAAYPNTRIHILLFRLMVFGVAIELAQYFAGWRFGDALDAVADAAGLTAAFIMGRMWRGN